MKDRTDVQVGQRWRSKDARDEGKVVTVRALHPHLPKAVIQREPDTNHRTCPMVHIAIDGLRKRYELLP